MPDDRYRFQLGHLDCLVVRDSTISGDSQFVFSNVSSDQLKAQGFKTSTQAYDVNCLAVFSDDWVLLDVGFGNVSHPSGKLADILSDEEIRPEHIILTHAHSDHIGGLLNQDGEEAYPNVPVYMCQREWIEYASDENLLPTPQQADTVREILRRTDGQIERIECMEMNEILPCFSVIRLPGHTANNIAILIEAGDDKLIYAADAVFHPWHLSHLDWHFAFDADHEMAREARIKFSELAIELDALVMFTHFPFPGLGKIKREGDAYGWSPISF